MIDYNTKLIEIDNPAYADLLRKAMIANALSIEGASGYGDTKELFVDLLGPVAGTWDLRKISTCALIARGLWARIKIDYSPLYKNYIFGTAISSEIGWAQKLKPRSAWVVPKKNTEMMPESGDYVVIGSGMMTHVLTPIGWDGDNIISIDGGQVDNHGYQCVKRRERKYQMKWGYSYIGNRKIIGWISLDMLPFKSEKITVPEGWENI